MKADQVDQALRVKFLEEDERLVFWDDRDGEFADYISDGLPPELAEITVLALDDTGGLSTKLLLDQTDRAGKYLLYRAGEPPPPEEDWLLDIRAYSGVFHADVASVWVHELGLASLSLRGHLRDRSVFMGNKERRKKLAALVTSTDTDSELDLKMMAVLAGTDVPQLFSVIRALSDGHLQNGTVDLATEPAVLSTFNKMGLRDAFWDLVHRDFGYCPDTPSLAGLLRALFVTEMHQQAEATFEALRHFNLPAEKRQNAGVCLTQWRDSTTHAASYEVVAAAIGEELHIGEHLRDLALEHVVNVYTFWDAERCVVSGLKNRVRDEAHSITREAVEELVVARRAGHWLNGPGSEGEGPRAVANSYAAIVAAAELFSLRVEYASGFSFDTPEALLEAYHTDLYRFDQLYRTFCANATAAATLGWDLLKEMAGEVEALYDQGFLQRLGLEWSRHLEDGFLAEWAVSSMPPQHRFYEDTVRPYLAKSDRKRAYVIISDAFRYEAAEELCGLLNGRYRMDAELRPMLGVLPSYTALGMASLLPHDSLSYSAKGDVLVDGKSSAGTEARGNQLSTENGMACRASELVAMTTDQAREFTRGSRVVYIYHDVVDARGDTASTEGETFAAVDDCIREVVGLVHFCVSKLNAATVWITADHGFLFQQSAPTGTDKSAFGKKPDGSLKSNKRFVLGRDLGAPKNAHQGNTSVTAGTEDEMEFWLPRGANRFNFVGGARFCHGGAMPQEVVVPLVTVKQLRGKKAAASKIEKVAVQLLGTNHKITMSRHRFEFIQTEAVSDRRKPLTLKVAVYEGSTLVTSIGTLVFDSESDSMEDRKRSVRLDLLTGEFDKKTAYRLVLRDAETEAEVESIPVVIDRSFESDF